MCMTIWKTIWTKCVLEAEKLEADHASSFSTIGRKLGIKSGYDMRSTQYRSLTVFRATTWKGNRPRYSRNRFKSIISVHRRNARALSLK